eukprot:11682416-Alexandrium_andersonii.AAC.1
MCIRDRVLHPLYPVALCGLLDVLVHAGQSWPVPLVQEPLSRLYEGKSSGGNPRLLGPNFHGFVAGFGLRHHVLTEGAPSLNH